MSEETLAETLSQATNRSAPRSRVEAVYREQFQHLWRALLAYSGDRDIASDAAAEAFAQALRRDGELRSPAKWVWKAAFRIAAGMLQERSRFVNVPVIKADTADSPFELRDALMAVSPMQRAALFLHYYGDYPPAEIARMVGSTQSAVRVHLFRGRKRLETMLREAPDG